MASAAPAAARQQLQRSIVITTMGTRGDVQPFVALALGLAARGWHPVLSGPGEYRSFVESYGVEFAELGRSLQKAVEGTPQGVALRTASPLRILSATRAFFSELGLFESWFATIRSLLEAHRPAVLLLTSFPCMTGAGVLPRLLGLGTKVVLAHTVPMEPTREFSMPIAGTGFTAPLGLLNSLQWHLSTSTAMKAIHLPLAQALVDSAAAELALGRPAGSASAGSAPSSGCCPGCSSQAPLPQQLGQRIVLDRYMGCKDVPVLYIYSPHLLPPPPDWPANQHVVGPLVLRQCRAAPAAAPASATNPPAAAAVQPDQPSSSQAVPSQQQADAAVQVVLAAAVVAAEREAAAAKPQQGKDKAAEWGSLPDWSPPGSPVISTAVASSDAGPSSHADVVAPAPSDGAANGSSTGSSGLTSAASSVFPSRKASPTGTVLFSPAAPPTPPALVVTPALLPPALAEPGAPPAAGAAVPSVPAAPAPTETEQVGLPAELQAFLDDASRRGQAVVYIGLGSMLGTAFEPSEVARILQAMAQGVRQLAAEGLPLRAILHTTLSMAGAAARLAGDDSAVCGPVVAGVGTAEEVVQDIQPAGEATPPERQLVLVLAQPVAHELLLPQVQLVVHHGGAGTMQATLAAGKPALVIPCVPTSDQGFWGDLLHRRGLGPEPFPVRQLSAGRLARGIREALQHLDEYTVNAERLAAQLAREDGVALAIALIEAAAAGCYHAA